MLSTDARWMIGTAVALAGFLSGQMACLQGDIKAVESRLTDRIDDVQGRVLLSDGELSGLEDALDGVQLGLKGVEGRLVATDEALGALDRSLVSAHEHLDSAEAWLVDLGAELAAVRSGIDGTNTTLFSADAVRDVAGGAADLSVSGAG